MADSIINIMTSGLAYTAFTRNTTTTDWSWGNFVLSFGRIKIMSFGISVKEASNESVNIGTLAENFRPFESVRSVCVSQNGTDTKLVQLEPNGEVAIYKPQAATYWGQIVYLVK